MNWMEFDCVIAYRSRLGCQVKMTPELDGMKATLPSATRNMFVDGKPMPFYVYSLRSELHGGIPYALEVLYHVSERLP